MKESPENLKEAINEKLNMATSILASIPNQGNTHQYQEDIYLGIYQQLEDILTGVKSGTLEDESITDKIWNAMQLVFQYILDVLKNIDWNKVIELGIALINLVVQILSHTALITNDPEQLKTILEFADSIHFQANLMSQVYFYSRVVNLNQELKTALNQGCCLPFFSCHKLPDIYQKLVAWMRIIAENLGSDLGKTLDANNKIMDDIENSQSLMATAILVCNDFLDTSTVHKKYEAQVKDEIHKIIDEFKLLSFDETKNYDELQVFCENHSISIPKDISVLLKEGNPAAFNI